MKPRRRLSTALVLCAAVLVGSGSYVHAKAWLAQQLLERAWQRSEAGATAAKPWPWADTRPVARLHVARLGVNQIVLAGDSGRTLAFGPAWNEASATPGGAGTSIISGHRDTHFEFLRHVSIGDLIEIERHGQTRRYRVSAHSVVDSRSTRIAAGSTAAASRLLLVTCYPFDDWVAGGPLRYVIEAEPV
jgi:sortase A